MENNKKYFKKLIKNYLELRKSDYSKLKLSEDQYIQNINKYIKKLEQTLSIALHDNIHLESTVRTEISIGLETNLIQSLNRSDIKDFLKDNSNMKDCKENAMHSNFALADIKKIIVYIRRYCLNKIYEQFEKNLTVESKIVRNDIFTPIEEGNLDAISISESFNNYKIYNEDGSTPLHVCIKNGDTSILKKFLKNGESIDLNNIEGHTLLEYACQLKDPNLISFLISHGADPRKHIFFRQNNRDCKMKTNDIDIANLIKICLQQGAIIKTELDNQHLDYNEKNRKILKRLCLSRIENSYLVGLGGLTFFDFYEYFEYTVFSLSHDSIQSYINIINEEFSDDIKNKLGCPNNHLEILVINLYPFIEEKYQFNLSSKFLVTNELILLIKFIFDKNNMNIDKNFNKKLLNKLWLDYKNILPFDYIGINLSNIFYKIKNILI